MTSEELHALHKELWGWLAENPGKDKHDWPGWKREGVPPCPDHCFACLEGFTRRDPASKDCTSSCPIGDCSETFGLWWAALWNERPDDAKRHAEEMRDLPWSPRPEVKP